MADGSNISAGTTVVGRVVAKSDLEIAGHVEGSVEATGDVTVASTALLKSDVKARNLVVAGAVAGNLHGEEVLVLEDGARVVGNVAAPTIGIRPGALVRGRVETSSAPPKATAPAARTSGRDRASESAGASESAAPARKAPAKRRAPAPVMPKAAKTATKRTKTTKKAAPKTAAKKAARKAPAPVVPALKKRTKKASKRRAR